MIVLVEEHATIGLGSGNSPTPIPNFAYVVSDEGSISRSVFKQTPTYETKAKKGEVNDWMICMLEYRVSNSESCLFWRDMGELNRWVLHPKIPESPILFMWQFFMSFPPVCFLTTRICVPIRGLRHL